MSRETGNAEKPAADPVLEVLFGDPNNMPEPPAWWKPDQNGERPELDDSEFLALLTPGERLRLYAPPAFSRPIGKPSSNDVESAKPTRKAAKKTENPERLCFPGSALVGSLGDLARLLARGTEVPEEDLWAHRAGLGKVVSLRRASRGGLIFFWGRRKLRSKSARPPAETSPSQGGSHEKHVAAFGLGVVFSRPQYVSGRMQFGEG